MARSAALGPERVDGWHGFSRIDAALFAVGVLALLAPALLPVPLARLAATLLGAGAAAVVAYKLLRLPLVPPLETAPMELSSYVRARGALAGPFVALVAAITLALTGAVGAWRVRHERGWPPPLTVLAGLTALAAVLRFAALGEQSLWYDELATAEAIDGDLATAWETYKATEATPPLFYALSWIWTHLFGSGDAAQRVISAAAVTAAVPVTFLAGRSLVSTRAGLLAAVLVAVNPTLVWYGQEARAYGLLVLFAALTLWAAARVLRRPTARAVALWAVVSALALFVHFFAVFLIAAEAVLIVRACRPRALAPAALLAPVALALLVLADRLGGGVRTGFISTIPLGERTGDIARELVSANTLLINANTAQPPADVGVLATVVLVAAVVAVLVSRRRTAARVPLLLGAGALLLPFLLTPTRYDFLLDRNLLPAWIPLAIALGAALAALPALGRVMAVAALVGAGLVTDLRVATDPGLQRAAWRTAVEQLGTRTEGRVVAVVPHFNRGMVRRYGLRVTPVGPLGIRTRELDLIGQFDPASVTATLPEFAVAATRAYPYVDVAALRAPRPVLLTPAKVTAAGLDPLGVLVEPSARAAEWIPAVQAQLRGWRAALDGDPQPLVAAARRASTELEPAPPDIPQAPLVNRRLLAAAEAGARWAAALRRDPATAEDEARAFDHAVARVPGAAQVVAPLTAVAATTRP